jgi:NAD-dependent dihydropyrimidine dehydrogenase PreA subunit
MRQDGVFIGIEVSDELASDPEAAARLEEACPVDIFARSEQGALEIVEENVDECVLCRLCLDATPQGGVRVLKLYDGEAALT